MKLIPTSIATLFATLAIANPVPELIRQAVESDRLTPVSVTYREAAEATEESAAATEAVVIVAEYRLRRGESLAAATVDGVKILIQPASNPKLTVTIEVPESKFADVFGADPAKVFETIQSAGRIVPNVNLRETVRGVVKASVDAEDAKLEVSK